MPGSSSFRGHYPQGSPQRARKLLLGACVLLGAFLGFACEQAPSFPLREPIPMGEGSVKVSCAEEITRPLPFFLHKVGKLLVVCLESDDFSKILPAPDDPAKGRLPQLALFSLSVVDRDGKRYDSGLPVPEAIYRKALARPLLSMGEVQALRAAMKQHASDRNFAVLFDVPAKSGGYTLKLRNPSPRAGQSRWVTVDLRL